MNRKWFRALFQRRVFVILLLLLQLCFIVYLLLSGSMLSEALGTVMTLTSLTVSLYIISKKDKGAYKLTWVFLIMLFPLFGGLFYLLFHFQSESRRMSKTIEQTNKKALLLKELPGSGYDDAIEKVPYQLSQMRYLQNFAGFPVYSGSEAKYLSPGERKFECLLEELKSAERYIFLEYFTVQEGVMWDSVLEILKDKAAKGVKVRLMYDDLGCFLVLPSDYPAQLKKYGIECRKFNPFRPFLTAIQNNRDHRKIVVIDGKTAFVGGVNLADEYINVFEKHGHWKDAAAMVKGKAAWSVTLMFLQMWETCTGRSEDYSVYYPWKEEECKVESDGFVQPYADSPMDRENVGEHVYLHIINNAKKYLYITTPYLIVDDSMISALTLAAKSGVDVRIITPHIWDKRLVHITTRSYYRELINAGVRIYEYSKGFMHSKLFVSDDITATVGTTNLDFRSLYLHFECGLVMYGTKAVADVKEDFLKTLEISQEIKAEDCKVGLIRRLFQDILRVFAPLM